MPGAAGLQTQTSKPTKAHAVTPDYFLKAICYARLNYISSSVMEKFRLCTAAIALISSLTLCILQLIDGQIIAAICYLACGLTFSYVLLFGTFTDILEPGYQSAAQLIGILGMVVILWNHNATKIDLQQAYTAASMDLALLTEHCTPVTPKLRQLEERGLMACVSQNTRDLSNLNVDLQKGIYLGPALSLADGAANIAKEKDINLCAQTFKEAYQLCPHAFLSLDKKERSALLQAAE